MDKITKLKFRIYRNIQKTSQVKANHQSWRTVNIKRPDSARHLRTMSHASNDFHELFKFFLRHCRVVIAGVIINPCVLPHPPSSGLQGLNSPTNKKSNKIHSI